MQNSNSTINIEHVISALTTINRMNVSADQVKNANTFLQQSEANSKFPMVLHAIYCHTQQQQLQLSCILLLKNIIKRNWSNRRNSRTASIVTYSQIQKEQLRNAVLSMYTLHDMKHYKHINELIRYLTRIDFPANYPQLYQFVVQSLHELSQLLSNQDGYEIISSERVLTVLSTCKAVLKEYSLKKISHSEQIFMKYISVIVTEAVALSLRLHSYLELWLLNNASTALVRLIECLRKIDKVVLYAISSIPSRFQYKQEINQIVIKVIQKIILFDRLLPQFIERRQNSVCQQLQKYIAGLLQQVGRLQSYFPFMFHPILSQYLVLLMTVLVKNMPNPRLYQSEKLLSVIVIASLKPLNTFAYYQTPEQFKKSVYCRGGSQVNIEQIQRQCSSTFRQIYTTDTVHQLLTVILTQIMSASHIVPRDQSVEDNLILQDTENAGVDQVGEPSVYQNCVSLCRSIIKCFKPQCLQYLKELARSVPSLQLTGNNSQLIRNIMEIIFLLPSIYDENDLPLEHVCFIMQALYSDRQYIYLARLIRKYHSYLSQKIIADALNILAKVVASPLSPSVPPQIIYQSALALKTIISSVQSEGLPMQLLGNCISNLVSIMQMSQFKSNPNLIWPMLDLLVKLVKAVRDCSVKNEISIVNEVVIIIIKGLISIIEQEKSEELLVCALTQLIASLIEMCLSFSSEFPVRGQPLQLDANIASTNPNILILLEACLILLQRNLHNRNLQSYEMLYRLWLTLVRQYPTIYQQQLYKLQLRSLNQSLLELFQSYHTQLRKESGLIFVEIVEEYFLIGLLPIAQQELTEILKQGFQASLGEEERLRMILALASLYFSYAMLQGPVQYALLSFVKELNQLKDQISPQINSLRTFLFLLVDYHILNHPANQIFAAFTQVYDNKAANWLMPFFKNMQFVSNKFAFKLNAGCVFKFIQQMGMQNFAAVTTNLVEDQCPLDCLLKVIGVELQMMKLDFLFSSYNGIFKILLPNEVVPQFRTISLRKVRLFVSDRYVRTMIETDLKPSFQHHIGGLLTALGWSVDYLRSRIGTSCTNQLCKLLGWSIDELQIQ